MDNISTVAVGLESIMGGINTRKMMGVNRKNNNTVHNVNKMHNDSLQNFNSVTGGVNGTDGTSKLENVDFVEVNTDKSNNPEIENNCNENNEIRKQHKQTASKLYCFYCRSKIREVNHTKLKYVIFNSKKKIICRFCTSKQHKTLQTKFKNYETQCLMCNSKTNPVKLKNCLACTICKSFAHANCCKLSKTDVNKIEKSEGSYMCKHCSQDAFPHFTEDELKPEPKLKNKQIQFFTCCNKIDKTRYKNKKAEYKDDLTGT